MDITFIELCFVCYRILLGSYNFMEYLRKNYVSILKQVLCLIIGAALVAVGLNIFLVPNEIIDGGVVGISIMASYLTGLPLGLFTFFLNIPFLFLAYKQLGKRFVVFSLFSITMLSLFVTLIPFKSATNDTLLTCIFGGVIVGLGVGLILRNNGSLDGTEMIAVAFNKKIPLSVGATVLCINVFIYGSAIFVFGFDRAMYSLVTYFLISKAIDVVLEGIDEKRSIMIISNHADIIADNILHEFKRGVTFIDGKGAYSGDYKKIIYCIVTRLEITKLREVVLDIDPKAFISISKVSEVEGGQVKRRYRH